MILNSYIDIRQSDLYVQFMQSIGWKVEVIDGVYFYIKKIPLLPAVIKLQRPNKLPDLPKLHKLMEKYHANSISVEPAEELKIKNLKLKILEDPFLPTKTIQIDLTASEEAIFNSFTPAKRKAVRRAQNLGIGVLISNDIDAFIKLKSATAGFLGFMTTTTLKPLWETLSPKNASILMAYCHPELVPTSPRILDVIGISESHSPMFKLRGSRIKCGMTKRCLAGIFLLHFDNVAYYWVAAATQEGKKLFAPTLLVWEALKLAKEKGCTSFDFEGIYDERFSQRNKGWLGFTRFKQGFGGKEVFFPEPFKVNEGLY